MRPTYIISIIILSLSISSWGGNARTTPANVAYPWAGFALSLEWPAGFCEINDKCDTKSLHNKFNIHALYPLNAKGTKLSNCDGTEFDVNSVSDFKAEMHLAMPSLVTDYEDKSFWKHEWDKYGKCSEDLLKQTDYFRTALAFRNAFDILEILFEEGIYPSGALYQPDLIKGAIKKYVNAVPALTFKKSKNSEYVLTDIQLCMNQLATRFVDCPTDSTADTENLPLKFVSLASQVETAPRFAAI